MSLSVQLLAHDTFRHGKGSGPSSGAPRTREKWFTRRVKLGFGQADGGTLFAFVESGNTVRNKMPSGESEGDETNEFSGVGVGLGATRGWLTASGEFVFGGHNQGDFGPYLAAGLEIRIRLWRFHL